MQLGMIGLGRMGSNMVRRLLRAGHECVVFDTSPAAVRALADAGAVGTASLDEFAGRLPAPRPARALGAAAGAVGTASLDEFAGRLAAPRAAWLMVPAAVVDRALGELLPRLERDDVVVDGGNSWYGDDIRRAKELAERGVHHVDGGTSGGVVGLGRGFGR